MEAGVFTKKAGEDNPTLYHIRNRDYISELEVMQMIDVALEQVSDVKARKRILNYFIDLQNNIEE